MADEGENTKKSGEAGFLRTLGRDFFLGCVALLRLVMGFIKEGFNVFICPEGHRTEDGRLQPLEGGVAIMALKTGAPVVPTYAAGTWRALAPHMRFPRPCKLTVTFGDPRDPAQLPEGLNEKEKRRYILDKFEEFYKEQDAIDKAKHPLPERGAA